MAHAKAFIILGLILGIASAAAIADATYRSRVYPGVRAAGVELGGLVAATARERLTAAAPTLAAAKLTVVGGGRSWTATNAAIGLELDIDKAVAEALRVSKDGNAAARLWRIATTAMDGADIGWPRRADDARLEAFIDAIARDVEREAVEGAVTITVDGVEVREPREGVRLERDRLRSEILSSRELSAIVPLTSTLVPPDLDEDAIAEARADAIVAYRPMRLVAGSESVIADAPRIAVIVRVIRRASDDGDVLAAIVDGPALGALVGEVADRLDGPVRDALLVPGGERLRVEPGRDGVTIDRVAARSVLEEAIFEPVEGERVLTLPGRIVTPVLSTAQAERIAGELQLAGGFTTFFPENWARANNIGLAAARFDGLVVAPGESFSFWDRIGEVSARTGYVQAGTIIGGVSAMAIGGGLCQVSTTLFNAVARAGLRIDERHPHSYYIERYPMGLDAAVFAGSVDLKWTNDTAFPMLLRGAATATSVSFWVYSALTGRTAVFPAPIEANLRWPAPGQAADPAHAPGYIVPGRDVWASRIVLIDGVETRRDVWYSHYAPVWGGPAR